MNELTEHMRIGELAKASATSAETIRFYERRGLLCESARTSGNFRLYSEAHVERLKFIRLCRLMDMGLDDIRDLLASKASPPTRHKLMRQQLDNHLSTLGERIEELVQLKKELHGMRRMAMSQQCEIRRDVSAGNLSAERPCAHADQGCSSPAMSRALSPRSPGGRRC